MQADIDSNSDSSSCPLPETPQTLDSLRTLRQTLEKELEECTYRFNHLYDKHYHLYCELELSNETLGERAVFYSHRPLTIRVRNEEGIFGTMEIYEVQFLGKTKPEYDMVGAEFEALKGEQHG